MDVTGAIAQMEAAMAGQVALGGGDPAIEEAATMLTTALRSSLRQVAIDLAQQAAAECAAQLPGLEVDVVLREGDPELVVRASPPPGADFASDDLEARLTLRLPAALKQAVEEAAGEAGDSINAHVIRLLSQRASGRTGGKRITGRLDT